MKTKHYVLILLLAAVGIIVVALLVKSNKNAGSKAPDAVITDQAIKLQEIKAMIDALEVVDKDVLTINDRVLPENAPFVAMIERMGKLQKASGVKFYAWLTTKVDGANFTEDAYRKLTAKNPRAIPFFCEDFETGNIYIAPAAEQENIIAQYKKWFLENGANL